MPPNTCICNRPLSNALVECFDEETAALETRRSHEVDALKTKLEEREVCVFMCVLCDFEIQFVQSCALDCGAIYRRSYWYYKQS